MAHACPTVPPKPVRGETLPPPLLLPFPPPGDSPLLLLASPLHPSKPRSVTPTWAPAGLRENKRLDWVTGRWGAQVGELGSPGQGWGATGSF